MWITNLLLKLNQVIHSKFKKKKKKTYLCVYPFFLGVITCSKKEFVLFCLKVREKGKKKKARYSMARATQETLELARSYY